MPIVLVVDDKEMMRDSVATTLQRTGLTVWTAPDAESALAAIAKKRPDAVVSDLKMPGLSGIELIDRIQELDDELPVILMTAFGTISTAVDAMRRGAFDYLTKPFEGDELIIAVKRAIEHGRVVRENRVLRINAGRAGECVPVPHGVPGLPGGGTPSPACGGIARLIGTSPAMIDVQEQVKAVGGSHGTVLITGESGSGKEVVARAIHEVSPRASGPFLAVNCAALSESLLESELFGHERGAFTGAERTRKGRFELADGGTLLLDEVSEVSPQIQAKLLRVLQERAFERVGSSLTIGVDVRVVATSNKDLPRAVAKGEFRQDLYFRLNVLPLSLPALRERRGDVPMLAEHFVNIICQREGRPLMSIDPDASDLLARYQWPGNVRELQNICERAVVLGGCGGSRTISARLIEPWIAAAAASNLVPVLFTDRKLEARESQPEPAMIEPRPGLSQSAPESSAPSGDTERTLEDIERDAVVLTLQRFNGHRQKTAHVLGIGVRTLGLKLKKWKQCQLVERTL